MSDKVQLIKEEIERMKEHTAKCGYPGQGEFENGNREGRNYVCDKLLSFIDSLPEENHFEDKSEMVSEDLDIAATSIIKRLGGMEKDDCVSEHELKIFKAAIDWQKKKDQETIELAEDHAMLAGMNKMKEEMMKDAVEGTVKYEIGSAEIPQCDKRYQVLSDPAPITNAKLGDKVKILILKTE